MNIKLERVKLYVGMLSCQDTVKNLLTRINNLETDALLLNEEKLSEIKKIREEITKVGEEIDIIKKEITLLYS